nr:hypothetical protein [Armatimonadota bacterium]
MTMGVILVGYVKAIQLVAALLSLATAAFAAPDTTRFDFEGVERGYALSLGAAPSDDPASVIAGKRSLLVDTTGKGFEWCEFFITDPTVVKLEPGATYVVSFKYRILNQGPKDPYLS